MHSEHPNRIIERLQNGLETLRKSTQHLERLLTRFFQKLGEKGVHINTDAQSLLSELKSSQRRVEQSSQDLVWLVEQSMELARVSTLIGSSLNLNEVLEAVMDTVIELTHAERAYLMLRRPNSDEMDIVAARNWARDNVSEADIVFSRNVIRTVLESGQPLTTANATTDKRFENAESVFQRNLRSILCVPLQLRGQTIGVLYADNHVQHGVFRQENLSIMVAFAQQTAVAIENAQLYERLERAAQQLQEANRLKSEFLSVISHELKTPFASLGFAVQIFPRYGMEQLGDDQRKVWDDLVGSIQQAQNLVNNLVSYAALLSKQGTLQLQHFNLAELLHETIEDAQRMAHKKNIQIHTDFALDEAFLYGDRERLAEAFWHLLQNAIQYNKPNGQVWVRLEANIQHIIITFEDSGVGIPPEAQERIWEAFEQMSNSLTRGVEGLGLGLPLVRYVVQAHGGNIKLNSVLGEGSQFIVQLPLSRSGLLNR